MHFAFVGASGAGARACRRAGMGALPPVFIVAVLTLLSGCGEAPAPLWPGPGADAALADASPARGASLMASHGCVSCHAIPGVRGPWSGVGPPLDAMARRAYIGGVLPNTPENMIRWLQDPPAVNPRTAMPAVGLTYAEAADIAAYLGNLR